MRYTAGALSAGAGSTTLPIGSLYAASAVGGYLREVGVFNTTDVSLAIKLVRLTTAGTQGSGLTEDPDDPDAIAASCTAVNTHTGAPTLGNDMGYRAQIGGSKGAGVVWVMGGIGKRIKPGTGNGIGIIVENGTGQVCQFYFVWDE